LVLFYVPFEVIKLLLKTFPRIFYILRDNLTQKLKWDTLYIELISRARTK